MVALRVVLLAAVGGSIGAAYAGRFLLAVALFTFGCVAGLVAAPEALRSGQRRALRIRRRAARADFADLARHQAQMAALARTRHRRRA